MTGFEAKTILKNTAFLATVSSYQEIEDAVQFAIDAIEKQERTGSWVDEHCSECGCYVYHGDIRNFCPNCETKMEN